MHSTTKATAVYQTIRILPEHERPAYIYRKDDKTIVAVDPRDSRIDITMRMVDSLTVDEQNAYRAAYGYGPVGSEVPESHVTDAPCLLYVPPELRLVDEPALQGGAELQRRLMANDLHEELLMLDIEKKSQVG